jgi:hypothetical protein
MKTLWIAVTTSICYAAVDCHVPTSDRKTPEEAKVALGIGADNSLTLDRKLIKPQELAAEWRQLPTRIRENSERAGKRLDGQQALPAIVVIWAADETPYSLVHSLTVEGQKYGFARCALHPRSRQPDPFHASLPPESSVAAGSSDLPEVLRTIPIRLHADGQGKVRRVAVGEEMEFDDFEGLELELRRIQDEPDTPFDRAILRIDPNLRFSELVRAPDLLIKYRITKIGSVETTPEDGC